MLATPFYLGVDTVEHFQVLVTHQPAQADEVYSVHNRISSVGMPDQVQTERNACLLAETVDCTVKAGLGPRFAALVREHRTISLIEELDSNLANDPDLQKALSNARLSVLGIVWNKVDNIMHGMQMQTAGMHNQVRLWASQGHLQQLLARLHSEGFAIYLTADHGNVTATGIGNPREGVLAETKGKRVRVYDRSEFLEEVASKFPESFRWPNYGLPPARLVLLSGNLKAFADAGDEVVSHGGIALEEALVPFVAITREER